MKKEFLLLALLLVFSIVHVSAMACNPATISVSYQQGQAPASQTIACANTNSSQPISISSFGSFFQVSPTPPITVSSNQTQSVVIQFNANAPVGTNTGFLLFSDGSTPVTITANVAQPFSSEINVFPLSKVVTLQQGETRTDNIIISVPSSSTESLRIQSVDLNPATPTIRLGDQSLGTIAPGSSLSIPVVFSGVNAQSGTYSTTLRIFATRNSGQITLPTVSLQLQVTNGVSPIDNSTFTTRPSCALSAVTMNTNGTYTLTCTGVSNNVQVNPLYSDYFEGVNSEISSGIYRYNFKPVKFGITNFTAFFTFSGSPIYAPFMQNVQISSIGLGSPGTNLKVISSPTFDLAKPQQNVQIQIVDNLTNSLVAGSQLYIDGVFVSPTGLSFPYTFQGDKNYSLRATAPGYADLVDTVSVHSTPIVITVNPTTGTMDTTFNISTNVNASLFLNGNAIGNPYSGKIAPGNNTIVAIAEGYTSTNASVFVDFVASYFLASQLKKDEQQILKLSKNMTWEIRYQEEQNSPPEFIVGGEGNEAVFTPEKTGIYTLYSKTEDKIVGTPLELEGWDGKILGWAWYLWSAVAIAVIGGYSFLRRKRASGGDTDFSGMYQTGGRPNSAY